jgi:hypothetical protein
MEEGRIYNGRGLWWLVTARMRRDPAGTGGAAGKVWLLRLGGSG